MKNRVCLFFCLITVCFTWANAAIITGAAASNFSNTGPGWTFSDTGVDLTGGSIFTNGFFTLTWSGDTSPGAEAFDVTIETVFLGILNSSTNADDRFVKLAPWDDDVENSDIQGTGTVALTDVELNSILADGIIEVTFHDDLTGPGDWIDWWNQMDWELTYAVIPESGSAVLLAVGLISGGLAGIIFGKRKKNS